MKQNDFDYMKVIWDRLDQYKTAVIGKKSLDELKVIKGKLQRELAEMAEYGEAEVTEYFESQCRNIEARYSFIGHPLNN